MRTILIIGPLLLTVACDNGSDRPETGPTRMATAVAVNPAATNLLRTNQEQTYTASVRWSDNTETIEPATWRSDATAVASVDNAGKARGLDAGEATLVAATQGLEGTLRIRVVPNYEGAWGGAYTVRGCRETGDWREIEGCVDTFVVGQQLLLGLSLTQDRDRLSGEVTLGDLEVPLTSGTIRIDGGAAIVARAAVPVEGTVLTFVLEPFEARAKADVMTGSFTMTVTGIGLSGSIVVDADIPGLSGLTFLTVSPVAPRPELAWWSERLRRLRR